MFFKIAYIKIKFFNLGVSFTAFRSGYTLQVLTGYACCGLFAAIPHAENKVK